MRAMPCRFLCCVALFACLVCAASPARAEPRLEDFQFHTIQEDGGVEVVVRFRHPVLGWVEAGSVAFAGNGGVTLHLRGEEPRQVGDLSHALARVLARHGEDALLGRQLAEAIQRRGEYAIRD